MTEPADPLPSPPDVVCEHGTAMDVHCCNCHSGFIFDLDHECPESCEFCGKADGEIPEVARLAAQVAQQATEIEQLQRKIEVV